MKKLLFLLSICVSLSLSKTADAQWVTIPDANFVTWLTANYPTCMSGNQMDTTCSGIVNETFVDCDAQNINDLTGIQYFDSLSTLYCFTNNLASLPVLPNSLYDLDCSANQLTSLTVLPNSLNLLNCAYNQLTTLPVLPNSLTDLECYYNAISSLPVLPINLSIFYCFNNIITSIPLLPNSLTDLRCSGNIILSLPSLPNSLADLYCSYCQLSAVPILPNSLIKLYCGNNQLTALPPLPNTLTELDCSNNLLTLLPALPHFLDWFVCSNNPNLNCLPTLHSVNYFHFQNTGITCLPNYPQNCSNSLPSYLTMPLCYPGSGCPIAWNIQGVIHQDTSSTCVNDSLFPASEIKNVKVQLFHNGTLQQQMYPIPGGLYSFDTYVPDTAQVKIDTTGLPIYVECPNGGVRNEILSVNDSLHYYEGFGMKCNGVDVGVTHIYGRFRPSFIRPLKIYAGDISLFYNMNCSSGTSGTVKTILSGGQITYVSPYLSALNPNTVSGDTLTYNISDFGSVNFLTDFNILVHTNNNAIIGAPVCVTVHVSTAANDINHNNDSLTFCSVIVSSYDPNEKEVYPDGNLISNEWLTYTINFQNTGNDTAFGVIVRDTLSQYLDEANFQYLASSHNCVTQLFGSNVVFSFPHINLVDSFTNESLSHGWVQFKIRLKNNCPSGVNISNRSSIYFDSNAPVLTNSTMNHFCLPNGSNISAAICQGEIYHFGGAQLTVAGNYVQHYINAGGCDSAVNLHLTVDSLTTLIAQNSDSLSATSNGTIQWFDCNTNQIVATGNNFVATTTGDYAVIATNGSCVDTSACLHVTSVDGFSISDFGFRIYPNPASDELNFVFSNEEKHEITITDLFGREMIHQTFSIRNPKSEIRNLPSGIYFVEVRCDNYFAVKKFVKD